MTSKDFNHDLNPITIVILHELGFEKDQVIDEYEYVFGEPIKLYEWVNLSRRQSLHEFVQYTNYSYGTLHIYKSVYISGDPQDPNNHLDWADWKTL